MRIDLAELLVNALPVPCSLFSLYPLHFHRVIPGDDVVINITLTQEIMLHGIQSSRERVPNLFGSFIALIRMTLLRVEGLIELVEPCNSSVAVLKTIQSLDTLITFLSEYEVYFLEIGHIKKGQECTSNIELRPVTIAC